MPQTKSHLWPRELPFGDATGGAGLGVCRKLVAVAGEELHQLGMGEQLFPADLQFFQYTNADQFLEVA
ncbi:hypothetical protein SDC9_135108 [bioreactor metagenome]|uniref:Uncharacterized protein n=1 Tax=bioreactor metagenome TaxID=1076179 RepID=A0A645DFG4_9ZZZZ